MRLFAHVLLLFKGKKQEPVAWQQPPGILSFPRTSTTLPILLSQPAAHISHDGQQNHGMATCLLWVMSVVPGRLCLNIKTTVETAAHISTFLITTLHVPGCSTCNMTQINLEQKIVLSILLETWFFPCHVKATNSVPQCINKSSPFYYWRNEHNLPALQLLQLSVMQHASHVLIHVLKTKDFPSDRKQNVFSL